MRICLIPVWLLCMYMKFKHIELCGVLKRQLKLAVRGGHFDSRQWGAVSAGGRFDRTPTRRQRRLARHLYCADPLLSFIARLTL